METVFSYIESVFNISSLNDFQKQVLIRLFDGEDVFVSRRTGCGKSLCYEAYPLFTMLHAYASESMVIVIEPLISIMEEQVSRLNKLGFSATYIGKSVEDADDIKNGLFSFLFSSPESILGNEDNRNMLSGDGYKDKRILLVIDEAHVITEWGECGRLNTDVPFRKWFGSVGELRSIMSSATVLLLTATASQKTRNHLKTMLGIGLAYESVDSPDRPNIMLHVNRFKGTQSVVEVFQWLILIIKECKRDMPRILLFCRSINDVGSLYIQICSQLEKSLHHLITMYHSNTLDSVKHSIHEDMNKCDGNIRLLICTSVAGMGVNFLSVTYVIHYGPPYTADSFIQQMGRAGRDGTQSHHLLLYSGKQRKGVDSELLSYIDTVECRRNVLFTLYGEFDNNLQKHFCCDNCATLCTCDENCLRKKDFPLMSSVDLSDEVDDNNDNLESNSEDSDIISNDDSDEFCEEDINLLNIL